MTRHPLPLKALALFLSATLSGCAMESVMSVSRMPTQAGAPTDAAGSYGSNAGAIAVGGGVSAPIQQGGGLKGGEVDDNADFAKYLSYLQEYQGGGVQAVDVSQRYQLRVTDRASLSVPNALVTVKQGETTLFSARTTSAGRTLFFPRAITGTSTADYSVTVAKGGYEATASLSHDALGSLELPLPMQRGAIAPQLDICFVLDVTGSMSDELGRVQRTIRDISARIKGLPGNPAVRYGLVAYRDRGSDYVTKVGDFTTSLDTFQTRLDSLSASGGGDYPEAVNEALTQATHAVSWDTGESLRLMFVVGDAPPHMDYVQDVPYSTTMLQAASKGIKIFPLAASGLDAAGEYVFRQLAQVTNGKFLFITYGGTTPHDVGPVQENNLDDLVVDIVRGELQNLE